MPLFDDNGDDDEMIPDLDDNGDDDDDEIIPG